MSENINTVNELLNAFTFEGEMQNIRRIDDGHINNTFVFEFNDNGKINRYLVQELNTSVFTKPVELMDNIVGVTHYLREKIIEIGGDPDRECLFAYKAKDGKTFYIDSENRFWRCFNYIHGAH